MARIKKAQAGKNVSKKESPKKESPKMNFKSSDNWADNYSVDTTGLSKGSSNYYPYERSNGTRGVVTRGEAKDLVDKVKSGKLKKSDWFKSGGKMKKAQAGGVVGKSTKKAPMVDPKGAFTKVQERTIAGKKVGSKKK